MLNTATSITDSNWASAGSTLESARRPMAFPVVATARVRLRPFALSDIAPLVAAVATHRIADSTLAVPYPFFALQARRWIESHDKLWKSNRAVHWAVCDLSDDHLAGYVGLQEIDRDGGYAELSFWISERMERRDLAIEASQAALAFAFSRMALQSLEAHQVAGCQLVGRVLQRIGMQAAHTRLRVSKWGRWEEVVPWTVCRSDWIASL